MSKKPVEIQINDKQINEYLEKMLKKLGDLSPVMRAARNFLKLKIDENFETEGEATGEKWQDWSDSWRTKRQKRRYSAADGCGQHSARYTYYRGSGKILTLEGDLRKSIMSKSGRDFALVGTNKEYAALHNFGFRGEVSKKSKKGKRFSQNISMPKREFMRLDEKAYDELYSEIYFAIQDLLEFKEIKRLRGL